MSKAHLRIPCGESEGVGHRGRLPKWHDPSGAPAEETWRRDLMSRGLGLPRPVTPTEEMRATLAARALSVVMTYVKRSGREGTHDDWQSNE